MATNYYITGGTATHGGPTSVESASGTNGRKPYHQPTRFLRYSGKTELVKSGDYEYQASFSDAHLRAYVDHRSVCNNIAVERLVQKIQDAQLGTVVATMDKSYGMIADRAMSMYKGLRAVKQGRLGDAFTHIIGNTNPRAATKPDSWTNRAGTRIRNGTKSASATWLEFHYGWSPLANDILSAARSIHTSMNERKKVSGSGKYSTSQRLSTSRFGEASQDYKSRAGCYVVFDNKADELQLSFWDFPNHVWEVLPWSFVVDWFVPVNAWLTLQSPVVQRAIQDPWTSNVCAIKRDEGRDVVIAGKYVQQITRGQGREFLRDPGISVKPVVNTKPLRSLLRAGHAVSLLTQQIRSL